MTTLKLHKLNIDDVSFSKPRDIGPMKGFFISINKKPLFLRFSNVYIPYTSKPDPNDEKTRNYSYGFTVNLNSLSDIELQKIEALERKVISYVKENKNFLLGEKTKGKKKEPYSDEDVEDLFISIIKYRTDKETNEIDTDNPQLRIGFSKGDKDKDVDGNYTISECINQNKTSFKLNERNLDTILKETKCDIVFKLKYVYSANEKVGIKLYPDCIRVKEKANDNNNNRFADDSDDEEYLSIKMNETVIKNESGSETDDTESISSNKTEESL